MIQAIKGFMLLLASFALSVNALPAFPGAQGWGADATGGRGGAVVHVTNLSAYGTGSFAAALATSGAKIIVFDVGGVIDLQNQNLTLTSNTTIAGQTAPGGITLKNGGLYTLYQGGYSNMIVRFLRVRRSVDAADGDCFRISHCTNYILDHCSGRWNSDETLDISPSSIGTIQYCILAEPGSCYEHYGTGSGNGNNMTLILGNLVDGQVTMYKNLFAHSAKRTPYLSNMGTTAWQNKTWEIINNVFYDNMQGSYESFDSDNTVPLNLMGNYYSGGPSASYPTTTLYAHSGTVPVKKMIVHASGNYHADHPTVTVRNAFFNNLSVLGWVDTMIPPKKTTSITTALLAHEEVMAVAGPFPRDSADARTAREAHDRTGSWMSTCDALSDPLMPQVGTKPADTDNDGMSNVWETAHGLNPNSAADRLTKMNGGYDALEVYINELADSLARYAAVEGPQVRSYTFDAIPYVQVLPNPFNNGVRFTLLNMDKNSVSMSIYDVTGKNVYSARTPAGVSVVNWNGHHANGSLLASGVYVARFTQGNNILEKRVSLIR